MPSTRRTKQQTAKKKVAPKAPAKKAAAKRTPAKAPARPTATKKRAAAAAAKTPRPRPAVSAARQGLPPYRRGIFIDVENTSNEESLSKVIDLLKIDRAAQPTEVYAVGNWRAVGQTMSRHLARLGATLVHSAPVTGVRDWSDLWIAVAAGRWIALAKPGDTLEIVSNDKAFEAVGDAAATAGVIFRRVPHRGAAPAAAAADDDPKNPRRRRRRGGRGRRRDPAKSDAAPKSAAAPAARAERPRAEPVAKTEPVVREEPPKPRHQAAREKADADGADGHSASHEQILSTIRRLTGGDPARSVNLDALANALKSEGFTRRPGSPRLIVRLRRMKDIEVHSNGLVRLVG